MANEVTIRFGVRIRKGNVNYRPPDRQYRAHIESESPAGPTPGSILVTTEGTDLDFGDIVDPGFCFITNIDNAGGSNISIGPYDPETDRFYPIYEIAPGEVQPGRLDSLLGWESYPASATGTGTGTSGQTTRLRLRAKSHDCYAHVEAFTR